MRGFSALRNTEGEALGIAPRPHLPNAGVFEEHKDIQISTGINAESSSKNQRLGRQGKAALLPQPPGCSHR